MSCIVRPLSTRDIAGFAMGRSAHRRNAVHPLPSAQLHVTPFPSTVSHNVGIFHLELSESAGEILGSEVEGFCRAVGRMPHAMATVMPIARHIAPRPAHSARRNPRVDLSNQHAVAVERSGGCLWQRTGLEAG